MTDDQGWGQTGYYKHPILKTPNLDAMAKNGLRFDRFGGAPQCSLPSKCSLEEIMIEQVSFIMDIL